MQTKEQIKEKVLSMIPKVVEGMTKNLDILLSECDHIVDLEEQDDNYVIPKLMLRALLKEEMFQYETYMDTKRQKKLLEQFYSLI